MFVKLLGMKVDSTSTSNTNNVIYGKFLSFYNELKTSDHFSNPLFIQLIAQEIFTFDKEIFKTYPLNAALNRRSPGNLDRSLVEGHETSRELSNRSPSMSVKSGLSNESTMSVNIINSYIEEVSTIREIIQKIIKRYIKKNNWSTDSSTPLSIKGDFFLMKKHKSSIYIYEISI